MHFTQDNPEAEAGDLWTIHWDALSASIRHGGSLEEPVNGLTHYYYHKSPKDIRFSLWMQKMVPKGEMWWK